MKGSVRKRGNVWSYYFDLGKINGQRKKKEKSGFISNFYGVLSGALKYALYPANYIKDNGLIHVKHTLVAGKKGSKQYVLGSPKTKSSYRTISIGKSLVDILIEHREWQHNNKIKYGQWYQDSNFVCTKENGEPLNINSYKYLSRVVNYELEINFSMHSLRHTHATLLLENGANIKDMQKRLGHSKIATTMETYSHVTEKMKNDTVNILEKISKKLPPTN